MSTYVYLMCLDHTPPLVAEDESGQHLYDLRRIRADVADRENVAAGSMYYAFPRPGGFDPDTYFRSHSARFLAAHPTCRIGIRDQYGTEYPTVEETP